MITASSAGNRGILSCISNLFSIVMRKLHGALFRRLQAAGLFIVLSIIFLSFSSCVTPGSKTSGAADLWKVTGWIDDDTYRIMACGVPKAGISSQYIKQVSAKKEAIRMAQKTIMDKLQGPHSDERFDEAPDARWIEMMKNKKNIITGGTVVAERYTMDDSCEIIYQVKDKNLREWMGKLK